MPSRILHNNQGRTYPSGEPGRSPELPSPDERTPPPPLTTPVEAPCLGDPGPPAEELQPGHAYFLLPAHLFHSVLSFVSLASSLFLLSASSTSAGKKGGCHRPFELLRTASGTLQIMFSDDFLVDENDAAKEVADGDAKKPAVLRGDEKLEKEYKELVGYGKAQLWAPKLETIQEVAVAAADGGAGGERRKGRGLPFLGRLGSRRRQETTTTTLVCGNGSAAIVA